MSNDYKNTVTDEVPAWLLKKGQIDEPMFCQIFLGNMPLLYIDDTFLSMNGAVDEQELTSIIYNSIKEHISTGTARRVESIIKSMKMECYRKEIKISDKEIHLRTMSSRCRTRAGRTLTSWHRRTAI